MYRIEIESLEVEDRYTIKYIYRGFRRNDFEQQNFSIKFET